MCAMAHKSSQQMLGATTNAAVSLWSEGGAKCTRGSRVAEIRFTRISSCPQHRRVPLSLRASTVAAELALSSFDDDNYLLT